MIGFFYAPVVGLLAFFQLVVAIRHRAHTAPNDLYSPNVLDSRTTDLCFTWIGAKLKDGFFEYLTQLPIPAATPAQQAAIAGQVQAILAAKAADPAADTAAVEAAVDAAVAALYGVVLPGAAAGGH